MSFEATVIPFTSAQLAGASADARELDVQQARLLVEYRVLRAPSKVDVARELAAMAAESEMMEDNLGRACFFQALKFMVVLPSWLASPELALDPDGEIAFDWARDDDMISVSIGANGRLTYVWSVAGVRGSNFGSFALGLPTDLLEVLAQIG